MGGGAYAYMSLSRDLDQRQREMQRLACEEVVRVERNRLVGEIGDGQWNIAIRSAHLYMHADFRFGAAEIELAAVDGLHQFLDPVPVSLLRFNDDIFRLAHLHSHQSLIKAGDHLARAYGEGQRLSSF